VLSTSVASGQLQDVFGDDARVGAAADIELLHPRRGPVLVEDGCTQGA
jgi:hypothetical protein